MTPDDNAFDSIFPNSDDKPDASQPESEPESEPETQPDAKPDTDTVPDTAPDADSAPRIVAETPVGGMPRRVAPPVTPERDSAVDLDPTPDSQPDPTPDPESAPEPAPDSRPEPEPVVAVQAEPEPAPDAESAPEPEPVAAAQVESEPEPDAKPEPEPDAERPAPFTGAQVRSRAPGLEAERVDGIETVEDSSAWDDDISPELAAVLFGGKSDAPAAEPDAVADVVADEAGAVIEAPAAPAPVPEPEPPADPINLTRMEDARRLRLTAEDKSAAAPDATLTGKVRYVRVEEPLKDDNGQRTEESWEYYKPDYPGLEGRLVREIHSEERAYADGSWKWTYERQYVDGGRDKRTVRASADRRYIEREDEVSKRDPETNKRRRYEEEARLILAPEEREEKRGFLSSLLGGDDEDEAAGVDVWRPATSQEARRARKAGGDAFARRKLFGLF